MSYIGTGSSDDVCKVVVKQAYGGGWYADYGHCSTPVYATALEAAQVGNERAVSMYGTTVRLIDLRQFGGR
jgi:hypothetical protein